MHITLGQALLLPDQTCEVNRMVFFTSRGAASTETAVGNLNVAICLNSSGNASINGCTSIFGSRPAFTLPSTLLFNPDTNEVVA